MSVQGCNVPGRLFYFKVLHIEHIDVCDEIRTQVRVKILEEKMEWIVRKIKRILFAVTPFFRELQKMAGRAF